MLWKERRFVEEYCVDQNATQAAIRAGYSQNGAKQCGHKLLQRPDVAAAIAKRERVIAQKMNVTQERIINELALVAFSDIGDLIDFTGEVPKLRAPYEITKKARRAVRSMKVRRTVEGKGEDAREVEVVEFSFWSKEAALEKLGKHLGMFPDRVIVEDPAQLSDEELERRAAEVKRGLRLVS